MDLKEPKIIKKSPTTKQKFDQAVQVATNMRRTQNVHSLRAMLSSPEIRLLMEDILDQSTLTSKQKQYLKFIFFDRLSKRDAIKKTFGRDLGYQEEAIVTGINESRAVKDFIDVVKFFYIKAAPIAALTEVEVMMNRNNDPSTRLSAAQSVQRKAGVEETKDASKSLPVQVIINMGEATTVDNRQINVEQGEQSG